MDRSALPARLTAIDAYRGLVMFLMLAEVLRLSAVSKALPDSEFWKFLAFHQSHVEWVGCSLHDLIQPSFTFLVGVSLPFSIASRRARGQSTRSMVLHAFWRALVLVLLGVFLRSLGKTQTNWTFEDTLTQIGLGYGLLFLIGLGPPRLAWVSLGLVLIGYWAVFATFPIMDGLTLKDTGVPPDWVHNMTGFEAHWNKNTNLAWAVDQEWMNLFPRKQRFFFNGGGYSTSSFIPTLATMILGLMAGRMLQVPRDPWATVRRLAAVGVALLVVGYVLGYFGMCPVVKRIWTPSWVLYSGGWCFLFLAVFLSATDASGHTKWTFPLVVIGANSIAAYVMEWLFMDLIRGALVRHLGVKTFQVFGTEYESLLTGAATLAVLWLILYWMYRRKLFIKI